MTRLVAATSSASEMVGFWTTLTLWPSLVRFLYTVYQPEPSTKPPWTRTTLIPVIRTSLPRGVVQTSTRRSNKFCRNSKDSDLDQRDYQSIEGEELTRPERFGVPGLPRRGGRNHRRTLLRIG